jgi:hypothetical protein
MVFKKNQLKLTFLNGTSWLKSYKYAKNLKILDLNSMGWYNYPIFIMYI